MAFAFELLHKFVYTSGDTEEIAQHDTFRCIIGIWNTWLR